MTPITFYPGPSRLYPEIGQYLQEAVSSGILSMNHRSEAFMELDREAKALVRDVLDVPDGYEILFVSSATEAWEIYGQSLVTGRVQHYYNGAFGDKWATYTEKQGREVNRTSFPINERLPIGHVDSHAQWVAVTHNETSTGTFVERSLFRELHASLKEDQLLAVDATSSMAGIAIDFRLADYWFASVQKCFGLPSGLGVLIVSPRTIERAEHINERDHYNSFLNMLIHARNNQTHYTPNILAIYLLRRTLESKSMQVLAQRVRERYSAWAEVVETSPALDWLVETSAVRSPTVLALRHPDPVKWLSKARESGIIFGAGYGAWKPETFRIANFPAIPEEEVHQGIAFIRANS